MPQITEREYQWKRQDDGRYAIHDLEVLEPHRFGDDEYPMKRVREILKRTQDERPNGKALLGHNGYDQPEGYRLGRLTNYRLRGSRVYADAVDLEPELFARIARGQLPHRSIEFNPELTRIDALSFLGSNDQFFENFPEIKLTLSDADRQQLREDVRAVGLTLRSKPTMPKTQLPDKAKRSSMSVEDKLDAMMDHMSSEATARQELETRLNAIERRMTPVPEDSAPDDDEMKRSDDAEYGDEDEEEMERQRMDGEDYEDEEEAMRRRPTASRRSAAVAEWSKRLRSAIRDAGKTDPGQRKRDDILDYILSAAPNKRNGRLQSMVALLGEGPAPDDDAATRSQPASPLDAYIRALPSNLQTEAKTLRKQYREFDAERDGITEYAFVRSNLDPQLTAAQRARVPGLDYTHVDPAVESVVDEETRFVSHGKRSKADPNLHKFLRGKMDVCSPMIRR